MPRVVAMLAALAACGVVLADSGRAIKAVWSSVTGATSYLLATRMGDDEWEYAETTGTTLIVYGMDAGRDVTVAVYASNGTLLSGPSNTIIVPADECKIMDINGDGTLTAADALTLLQIVTNGECE